LDSPVQRGFSLSSSLLLPCCCPAALLLCCAAGAMLCWCGLGWAWLGWLWLGWLWLGWLWLALAMAGTCYGWLGPGYCMGPRGPWAGPNAKGQGAAGTNSPFMALGGTAARRGDMGMGINRRSAPNTYKHIGKSAALWAGISRTRRERPGAIPSTPGHVARNAGNDRNKFRESGNEPKELFLQDSAP
jgi:hypothetical protein